ncbi:MAG: hypothetical protein KatS3mg105_0145 [Gemmatales bacterium]|nr:MAG: hypothetical protein KatS3mg105_0145 [Gemmatales bacterium]
MRRLQKDELLLQWAPLLNDILPLDIPETPITREMKGQVRADNTHELMLRLLLQVRERGPLLIALEDAHWLDSASWALVLLVRQRLPDALLVLALRPMPEAAPAEFRELTRDNSLARIQLEALPGDDLRSFLCQRLGVDEVPAEVARLIEEKAHGNPFFSEELVYALRDAGWIEIEERTCRLRPDVKLEELELPDSVQGVITSRLDRLPPGLQMTWKVASVIGRVFACRLLNDIFPLADDRPKLSHYLQELEKLHVTMMETAEPELAYQFKHIILQEVAYNLMLFAHRQPLHRMIAEWYEQHFASDLAGYFPLLAFHWDRAGDVAKSLEYHEKAGEQALRNGVYREAVGFLREALRLLTPEEQSQPKSRHTPGGRVIQPSRLSQVMATSQAKEAAPTAIERDALRIGRCQRQLGEAYLGLGRLSESRHHLERAVAILGWPMPTTPARSYLRIGTQILQQLLYRLWPGPIATRSEAKRRAALEATRAFERLSEIYYLQNDKICLVNALLHSGNLAERVGPSPELAQAYASLAMTAALVPIHFLARLYRDRASDTARRIGQLSSIAWVLELSGLYGIGIGDWSRMHTDLNEAISIFEKLGDQPHRGECLAVKAQAKYMEGDFQEGLRLWREVFHSAQTRGDFLQVAWGMNGQAEAALIRGQTEQAIDFLESAARLFADNIDRVSEVSTRGMLAVAYRRLGDSRRAIDAAVQAQRLIEETGSPTGYYLLGGTADVAHVFLTLLEEGDHSLFEPARKAVAALWRYARVFRIGKPRACLQQGILYWITGRKTRAKLLWNKGLEWASRLAMPYDEGLIYARLARCSAGTEQEHYNHRASEIFSRLGAERDLRKLLISPTTVD